MSDEPLLVVVLWINTMILIGSSVIIASAGFYLVHQQVSAAQAGFVLTFALNTSDGLYGLLMIFSYLEQVFVSAERVQFCKFGMIPHFSNADAIFPDMRETPTESQEGEVPPISWPEQGHLILKNVTVRYAPELPLVLDGISLDIPAGQRVGIVGATGSGKSTLAMALLRAVEPERGSIIVDHRQIATVHVKALRERINIVTQDAVLASGTLREALDMTGTKSEHPVSDDKSASETVAEIGRCR